jgi:hypothetical protein
VPLRLVGSEMCIRDSVCSVEELFVCTILDRFASLTGALANLIMG